MTQPIPTLGTEPLTGTTPERRLEFCRADELRRLLEVSDDLNAAQKAAAATESIYTPLREGPSVAASSAWAPPVARTVSSRFDRARIRSRPRWRSVTLRRCTRSRA